ncbi:MAG: hypothetical protein JSS86_13150, partial [Cyanobacteria bacterium SZAS LIN-2]|nr:hypothetical protein [Cyanobacteria bacterium SZAS LIN-2]
SARGEKRDGFEEDKKERSRQGRKRLLKLLGNQALCLVFIFGLIGTCNWIATDYSGDYLGQNRLLRMVQLTISRRAATMDAELNYGMSGLLELDPTKDHPSPKEDKMVTLYFVTPEQWQQPGRRVWRAVFKGRIDGGKAVGTISDAQGTYKVSLEKNVLTSMFRHAQTNIPRVPGVPLPSLFDETEKSKTLTNTGSNAYSTYQSQNQNYNQNQTQSASRVRTSGDGQLFGSAMAKPSDGNAITGVKINR